MIVPGLDAEAVAQQLGGGGVDNLVTNAERICTYEQQRIELSNQSIILALQGQYSVLLGEENRIECRLQLAPPPGNARRLRHRAIYYWALTTVLTFAGFAFTLLTFAPFRLGWKSRLYCGGIAFVTPFLVEHMLGGRNMEKFVKALTAVTTIAALASLMLLAVIRGNLLAQEIHQDAAPAVVIDDAQTQPEPQQNTFYDSTLVLLRVALLLMAFTMEVGAGLALREAWRSAPDNSEDWTKLRGELEEIRQRLCEIVRQVTMLRNEPEIFANRFWRDFYRALLSNAARSALTKLLVLIFGLFLFGSSRAHAEYRLNEVIAIDLSKSVGVAGPDGKTEFQKNVEGVTRLLSQLPVDSRVTVIGITDHSFAQPYILLSARIPDDPGYFGERLAAARGQVVRVWRQRSAQLDPHFPQTDILGVLRLASEIFDQQPDAGRKTLVIFSDMRQSTAELNLELPRVVPRFSKLASNWGSLPPLHSVQVQILGVDGAGKSSTYWQSLEAFWTEYLHASGADLRSYSVLRDLPLVTDSKLRPY